MKSQLKFTLSLLVWTMLLLAAYAVTTRGQSHSYLASGAYHQPAERGIEPARHPEIIKHLNAMCDHAGKTAPRPR